MNDAFIPAWNYRVHRRHVSCSLSTELYHHLSNFLSSVSEGAVNAFRLQMTSFNREKEQLTGSKNVLCTVFM